MRRESQGRGLNPEREGESTGKKKEKKGYWTEEGLANILLESMDPKNFREEILKDIPTKEGKAVFEEMLKEQMDIFENILRGKITREELDFRTAENLIDGGDSQFIDFLRSQLSLRQQDIQKLKKEFRKSLKCRGGNVEDLEEGEDDIKGKRAGLADYLYSRKREADEKKDSSFIDARNRAEEELISEEVKKVLVMKELVTHHVAGFDTRNKKWNLGHYSDIDGSGAIGLLGLAGIDIGKGKYVAAGEMERGAANFDTGYKDGLVFEHGDLEEEEKIKQELEELEKELDVMIKEFEKMPEGEEKEKRRGEIEGAEGECFQKLEGLRRLEKKETVIFDHHGPYSNRNTSTTKIVFEVLKKFGLLKFEDDNEEDICGRLVDFITKMDNARLEEYSAKDFEQSHRTVLGLNRWLTFENLLAFFKEGRTETDVLSPQELKKYRLIYSFQPREGKRVEVNRAEYQLNNIERVSKRISELEKNGWVFSDQERNKFLIDLNGEAGTLGPWASAIKGYRGIIRYSPERNGFSVMFNSEYDLKKFEDLPQGVGVRGGMFFLPMDREKLLVNLDDIIARIAPNFVPQKGSELANFLDKEGRVVKTTITRSPDKKFWWARNLAGDSIVLRESPPKEVKDGDEIYIKIVDPHRGKKRAAERQENYPKEYYLGVYEPREIKKEDNQKNS